MLALYRSVDKSLPTARSHLIGRYRDYDIYHTYHFTVIESVALARRPVGRLAKILAKSSNLTLVIGSKSLDRSALGKWLSATFSVAKQ